ncbi:Allergen V5/Tpx-1 family protein [Desulforamulus reducens MI-1]|uniref:Allergen V5/Tpx-1 family protein n=1 Tax=Desulforamulus reducens (strain ATCC BAA-1160 / DSM 100696 / MI-1) TaxID=349161 RepID=A4J0M8_DESRM|nr:CAP domain-containing protein [Desulforamulus reducens]ABO48631.1 Allergen V5/Tpx-1 family protein [Desulforamulus reducens MI-1]
MQYRLKKVSVFLATLFLFAIMLPFMASPVALAATGDDQEMVRLVNEARQKAGITTLTYDQDLSVQASKNLEYYQRTGQSPSSSMLLNIAKSGGYSTIGQTIVRSNDVAGMVQKQLKYYGSRSILNTKYNRIGLAIVDTNYGKLCVQLLAYKPITEPVEQPKQPAPEPVPQPEPQPQPTPQPEPPAPQEPASFMNDFQKQVVDLVNAERAKYGLKPVVAKEDLTKVAQVKAQDMYQSRYFSHYSPNYGSPFDLMRKFGISYTAAGENIAMGQKTAAQVMQDWMNSSGHRANILNANYNEIGVGVYQSYNGYGYIWVQEFARR